MVNETILCLSVTMPFILILGIAGLVYFIKWKRLNVIPRKNIKDLDESGDTVEVNGKAYPISEQEVVRSPATGTECIGYIFQILKKSETSESVSYHVIKTLAHRSPLVLKDETGSVLVIDWDDKSMIESYKEKPSFFNKPSDRALELAKRYHVHLKGPMGVMYDNIIFFEKVMKIGQELTVIGSVNKTREGITPFTISSVKYAVPYAREKITRKLFWSWLVCLFFFFALLAFDIFYVALSLFPVH